MIRPAEPFKLPPIADVKSFLNLSSIIQYYLRRPEFSTLRSDDELVTDSRNADASAYWEGQLRVALQDGLLCYLFEHKGSLYDGKGFEMLAWKRLKSLGGSRQTRPDLPSFGVRVTRGDEGIASVVAFAEVKDRRAGVGEKGTDSSGDACSGLVHQRGRRDAAGKGGALDFLHLAARDEHDGSGEVWGYLAFL